MQHTDSIWGQVLIRASALVKRYRGMRDGPQNSWSLVGRAAQKFEEALPQAKDRDHAYALWTRAMVSVLNDLHRKRISRPPNVPMPESIAADSGHELLDRDTREALDSALVGLAKLDERKVMIVLLRHVHELTWEETAEHLGLSVGKTRREWDFSVAWLRRELRRKGVGFDQELGK